jgi:myo-inositol 2-dehydrogenase/D-chiro-inositol 1-dehydrogenase
MKRDLLESDRCTGQSRRGFLGSVAGGSLAVVAAPAGGVFAGGHERIRVGLIGCGGRGTGAALQAVAADPVVRIVALGDLFADQVASAAHEISRDAAGQFDCPTERRFVGERAYLDVLAAGVDLVLLAAPPHLRPLHVTAAVRAGKHIYCEKPAAIDLPGAHAVADACAAARREKLSVMSGLCFRRDEATRSLVERIRDGAVGRVSEVHVHAALGLPWRKPAAAGWSSAEWQSRNWISFRRFSGGHFVEHHIHAIDRALWALGDDCPVAAFPAVEPGPFAIGRDGGRPGWEIGDCGGTVAARYAFADGRELHASCSRGLGASHRLETAVGTAGRCDLLRQSWSVGAPSVGMYQATIDALVRSVRSGTRVDDGATLCRATLVAIMGRMAAETGRPVRWNDLVRRGLPGFPVDTIRSDMIAG